MWGTQPQTGWGPPPPGPPPGWQPPPPGWQQPGPPPGWQQPPVVYYARPDHPDASTAMVLGIVGLVVCSGLLSPWAWAKGRKAMREIDASGGQWGGRGQAQAGFILGIVGTVVLCLAVLYLLFVAVVIGISFSEGTY